MPHDADLNRDKRVPLTGEERTIERLCDEERYLELNTDVSEKMLYEGKQSQPSLQLLLYHTSKNSFCSLFYFVSQDLFVINKV